jgi:hypothetical protein
LRIKRTEMMSRYTELHPEVRLLDRQIVLTEAELEQARGAVAGQVQP